MRPTRPGSLLVPILLTVALLPRVVLPVGAVVCIESCGDLAVTTPHAAHDCHHDEGAIHGHSAEDPCRNGAHPDHDPAHPHDHDHDHSRPHFENDAVPPSGNGCVDVAPEEDWTRAEKRDGRETGSTVLVTPVLRDSFTVLPAPTTAPAPNPPPPRLGTCDHSILPLRV